MLDWGVRTTPAPDDDVLQAARDIARAPRRSLGEVVSALTRQALRPPPGRWQQRNGVPLLPLQPHAPPVTPELMRRLDEELR